MRRSSDVVSREDRQDRVAFLASAPDPLTGYGMKRWLGTFALGAVLAGCGGGTPAFDTSGSETNRVQVAPPGPAGPGGTPVATPPATPTGLGLAAGTRQFQFTWNPVADATEYRIFEDLDGAGPGAETELGSPAAAVTQVRAMPVLVSRTNAQYRVQACNAAGCGAKSAPAAAPALTPAIGYLKASNTAANHQFGTSMALSADGGTLVVGAPYEGGSGAAYVFVRADDGSWAQQALLKASNADAGDLFGRAVAVSADGGKVVVGAPEERSNASGIDGNLSDNSAPYSGAAYVFARGAGGTWTQQAYVKSAPSRSHAEFGYSLGLSGDGTVLAVGARDDSPVGFNVGAAFVFRLSAGVWTQEATIRPPLANEMRFGEGIALSSDGTTLLAGAPLEQGAGIGVDPDMNVLGLTRRGAVFVYAHAGGGTWTQQAYLKPTTPIAQFLGAEVALSADGHTVVAGARGVDAVHVFSRSGTTWSHQALLQGSNSENGDQFGRSMALSGDGNRMVVGADQERSNAPGFNGNQANNSLSAAGAAYLFVRTGTHWTQQAYLKPAAPRANARFGFATALSRDGSTLAVSARDESSAATGYGGNEADATATNAGAVYLY